MDNIKDIIKIKPKIKKTNPKYEFQETCLEIIKKAGLDNKESRLVWSLWKRKGYLINNLLAEIKAGEVKNPVPYIKFLLKK